MKRLRGLPVLCLGVMLGLASQGSAALRIMPLGDSITYGSGSSNGGYRAPLYTLLTNANYSIDYVGTQTGNPGPLVDKDHEGHGGWCISTVGNPSRNGLYENLYSWFGTILDPHIILLHIGTNDSTGSDFQHAIDRWSLLLDRIAECEPSADIIVTTILNRSSAANELLITNYFNPFVTNVVNAHVARGQKIHLLDMSSKLTLSDLGDGLHPTDAGYAKMAAAWFEAITNIVTTPTDYTNNTPALISGASSVDASTRKTLTLTFNMPVSSATATDIANYTLTSGVAVSAASLNSAGRVVTLTLATALDPGSSQTLTVKNIKNANGDKTIADTTWNFSVTLLQGAERYVDEYGQYKLVYSIDLPAASASYYWNVPLYSVDNSKTVGSFGRIAYYMEIRTTGGQLQYVWASMDAFTDDATKIGIPTLASQAVWQRYVTGLKVYSNVSGVSTGERGQGNLEFWPYNYHFENNANIPGASPTSYDLGDTITSGNYGCMQLHDTAAGKTIFAYNRWGGTASDADAYQDIGIGNCPGADGSTLGYDWTFTRNSATYDIRRLQVYVLTYKTGDTVAPVAKDAALLATRRNILLNFSKPLAAESIKASCFTLSNGAAVRSATLRSDMRSVLLTTDWMDDPAGLTVTVNGICDDSASANELAETTLDVVLPSVLPADITSHIGSSYTEGYELVYSIDMGFNSDWIGKANLYDIDASDYGKPFDRVAYYVELVKPNLTTQYVWVSMDAFTCNPATAGIPLPANRERYQQVVTNMDVVSNVGGVTNGTSMAGGNIEFWYLNYASANTLGISGASDSLYDYGDSFSTDGTYGCMQVHSYAAKQTIFAINHFGGNGQRLCLGIGNSSANSQSKDWTFIENGASYCKRTLKVLVRPCALPPVQPPAQIVANVPDATNFALVYSVDLPVKGYFNVAASNSIYHIVNNALTTSKNFSRVAYYLELVPSGSTATNYIWTAFDAFTRDVYKLSIPTNFEYQAKVANMDIASNVGGIQTGTGIQTGNIEFTYRNYDKPNTLAIPNASDTVFDYGDKFTYTGNYGCLQVHNYGARQTLFAINHFNAGNVLQLGIGNSSTRTDTTDWTHTDNANIYSYRRLYVMVNIDNSVDLDQFVARRAIGSKDRGKVCVSFERAVPSFFTNRVSYVFDNGITVTQAAVSEVEPRDVILTVSPALTDGAAYNLTLTEPSGYTKTLAFTAPSDTLPDVLNATAIPELGNYTLVNQLAIGNNVTYSGLGADYRIDESRFHPSMGFDRVAYCMELVTNGITQWAWVSMDAFTHDLSKIGVPTVERGNIFDCYVKNLNILGGASSGAAWLQHTGTAATGNIEFWPGNYSQANLLSIPNASDSLFDWGDTTNDSSQVCGHGSMQVHNYLASETVFSLCAFGNGGRPSASRTPSLGIGNDLALNDAIDWTFRENAKGYTAKNLYVLVRPAALSLPTVSSGDGPVFVTQPSDVHKPEGRSVRVAAYAVNAVRYQWRKNGVNIEGATHAWLDIPSAKVDDSGAYTVVAYYNDASYTISSAAAVTVYGNGTFITIW
jgi:lysophospholipase L1-like esterase